MDPIQIVPSPTQSTNGDALVYCRTSGRTSKSIPDQIDIARARIKERGWHTRYILSDAGLSGGSTDRPGYQQLLQHAEQQDFSILVVWKVDRIARSIAEMAGLEELLRSRGIMLHSCTEPIDTTTPQGRFMFGILASAGQLEREMATERITDVMTARAKRGQWLHATAPFGYCLGKNRSLRIHPGESRVVRHVFATHAVVGSYAETAASLNAQDRKRRGRRWTAGTVQRVIENTMHIGRYTHWDQAVERPNLRIVSDDAWHASIQVRQDNPRVGKAASAQLREQSIERVFDQYFRSLDFLEAQNLT